MIQGYLQALLPGIAAVHVSNFCTPASGSRQINGAISCGLDICSTAHVVLVKFSLNDGSISNMITALEMWRDICPGTIYVLDLWSWLQVGTHPTQETLTFKSAPVLAGEMFDNIGLIAFRDATLPLWPHDELINPEQLYTFCPGSTIVMLPCASRWKYRQGSFVACSSPHAIFAEVEGLATMAFDCWDMMVARRERPGALVCFVLPHATRARSRKRQKYTSARHPQSRHFTKARSRTSWDFDRGAEGKNFRHPSARNIGSI